MDSGETNKGGRDRHTPYEKSRPKTYKTMINQVKESVTNVLNKSWLTNWISISSSESTEFPQSSTHIISTPLNQIEHQPPQLFEKPTSHNDELINTFGESIELNTSLHAGLHKTEKLKTSTPVYTPSSITPIRRKRPIEFIDDSVDAGNSSSQSIQQQSGLSTKRPKFSASALGTSLNNTSFADSSMSVFYPGKTMYGGAANYRKPKNLSPIKSLQRAEVRAQSVQDHTEENVGLSLAAKKILDCLDKISTPLSEAKKIPTQRKKDFFDSPTYIAEFHKHRPSLRSSSRAPPVHGSSSPLMPNPKKNLVSFLCKQASSPMNSSAFTQAKSLHKESETMKKEGTNKQGVEKDTIKKDFKISIETQNLLTPKLSGDEHVRSSSFKMTTKQKHTKKEPEVVNDAPLPMPSQILPIKSLPKISFSPLKPPAQSYDKIYHEADEFKFSLPEEVDCSSSIHEDVHSKFTFSSPSKRNKTQTYEDVNSAIAPKEFSGFGSKFSITSGEWECGVCLIRNKKSSGECVACTTPNPNISAKSTEKNDTFKFGLPSSSANTNQFSFGNDNSKSDLKSDVKIDESKLSEAFNFGIPSSKPSGKICQKSPINDSKISEQYSKTEFSFSNGPLSQQAAEKPINSLNETKTASTAKDFSSFGSKFSMTSSEWECGVCLIRNKESSVKCVACTTPNPKISAKENAENNDAFKFGLPSSSANTNQFSFGNDNSKNDLKFDEKKEEIKASGAYNFGVTSSKSSENTSQQNLIKNSKILEKPKAEFSFSNGPLSQQAAENPVYSLNKTKTASTTKEFSSFGSKFSMTSNEWECGVCLIRNKESSVKCVACTTPNPNIPAKESTENKETFKFGIGNKTTVNSSSETGTGFNFGFAGNSSGTNTSEFSFGIDNRKESKTDLKKDESKSSETFKFGNSSNPPEAISQQSPIKGSKIKEQSSKTELSFSNSPVSLQATEKPVSSSNLLKETKIASVFDNSDKKVSSKIVFGKANNTTSPNFDINGDKQNSGTFIFGDTPKSNSLDVNSESSSKFSETKTNTNLNLTNDMSNQKDSKPDYSLQTKDSKAAFSFGSVHNASKTSNNLSFTNEETKVSTQIFDLKPKNEVFGSDSSKLSAPKIDSNTTATFSFGKESKISNEQKEDETSLTVKSSNDTTKASNFAHPFSFTNGSVNSEVSKPSLNIFSNTKPTFDIGSSDKKPTNTKPFSFGSSNDNLPTKSSFSFGSSNNENSSSNKASFSFGSSNNENSLINKASFCFGSSNENPSNKPSFDFGSSTSNKNNPLSTKPSFSFGSSNNDNNPSSSFSFDSDTSKKSTNKFDFSNGDVKPSSGMFVFGSSSLDSKTNNLTNGSLNSVSAPKNDAIFSFGNKSSKFTGFGNSKSGEQNTQLPPFSFNKQEKQDANIQNNNITTANPFNVISNSNSSTSHRIIKKAVRRVRK